MCAVSAGRKQNVVLLLEAGANVNLENENKETVLHMTKSMLRMSSLNTDNSDILEFQRRHFYGKNTNRVDAGAYLSKLAARRRR